MKNRREPDEPSQPGIQILATATLEDALRSLFGPLDAAATGDPGERPVTVPLATTAPRRI